MLRIRLLATAGAVAILVAGALAAPSQAHKTWAYHGNDFASVGDGHYTVNACDKEADGHRVRAQYFTVLNPSAQNGSWDPDGADGHCAHNTPGIRITDYRVCEEGVGCGPWKGPNAI
jgi:hypothetical protein